MTVGEISGFLNISTDYISGTVNAPWFDPYQLHLFCDVWTPQGGHLEQDVSAVNGGYECDFAGVADIQKGDNVAVMYVEPDDGDYVINVFREPAPDLEVTKWTEGDPAAGGRLTYWIEYWNHDEGVAYDVVMTDTLPVSTTYVVDTAPVGTMTTVNEVIWELGTLDPQSNGRFKLVIDIDAAATGSLDNHIEISTLDDTNPDNNQYDHSINIQPADVDLSVDKWIHRSEPAPGYNFKYIIQYNNSGSTGSGPVTLTDTLPIPTAYVDFYAQDALWYLVSNDGVEVVFAHPGFPGGRGDQIELTLHLSDTVNVDDTITNTARLATTNETGGSDNNFAQHTATVRYPHLNLGLNKQFAFGTTVADYEVTFRIDYRNHDNVPANNVFITDTLPAGTTFVTSTLQVWNGDNWEEVPFPPVQVTGDAVVFDLGTMEPATEGNIYVTVHIDSSVDVGTVLTNKAEIASLGPNDYDEDYFEDNVDTASIIVRKAGANLMIIKHDRSQWQGDPQLTIRYDFEVQNIGTVPVSNLKVIDTYPDVTTFNYADLWWGGDIVFQHNASLHRAVWTINETLWPGNGFGGQVTVDLDPDENRGSIFTNTIKIMPTTGDIYVQDNTDYEVLTTGPDLYIAKTTPSQWVEAGDLVTFTLRFGNKARRGDDWTQGNVLITDTLPSGMTYITSTILGCGGDSCPYFVPDIQGNKLVFDIGQQGDGWWNEIYLTFRVDDQAQPGDSFGNYVEIYSASPVDDPEGDYGNNTDSVMVTVYDPVFEVSKEYETSMVAGTLVTYTLNVTNTGNEEGSGVMLRDTLPTGLTYVGGDGSYSAGVVTWDLGTIAAAGGTASGWFNATLPCTLDTITNDDYAVSASDQGAVSGKGPVVNFDVVAPTLGGSFSQSASIVEPNTTVYFSATITTNGTGFTDYAWYFNDPTEVVDGGYANRTFTTEGTFTVTFAATDTCGYSIGALGIVTVKTDKVFIFLPLVVRNH